MSETPSHAMIFRFILTCFLLRFGVRAEDRFQRITRDIDASRYCDFDASRKNYDATDLLQCVGELASDLVDREAARQTSGRSQWNESTGRQISLADIFTNLFEDPSLPHQSSPFPTHATSSHYQSTYPAISAGTADLSPGFQLNLFQALSSISRHDDYKCIPRILCEMASGKLPGRSLGKQASSFFEFLGKNTLTEWLTKMDVAGASPLLNFGRAMILGYSNRGSSLACYRAFPKCPRDSNELVYYLNNYNGGLFRLFNRIQVGRRRRVGGLHGDQLARAKKRIIAESSEGSYRVVGVRNKIHFPTHERFRSGNEVTFPNEKVSSNEPIANGIPNYVHKSQAHIWQKDEVSFFPEKSSNASYSRIRFP
ncbi:uncharacterized protein LOC143373352 [Andrena cerasifolii]|uniref:uncharacterized protein LOC143373352 n=1 Tax=Andrena cerasifolii TaxID=2819439 RepID=UPI0040381B4B